MRTEKITAQQPDSAEQVISPTPKTLDAVANEVDGEFERYRRMRAELRRQSGGRRRSALLQTLN